MTVRWLVPVSPGYWRRRFSSHHRSSSHLYQKTLTGQTGGASNDEPMIRLENIKSYDGKDLRGTRMDISIEKGIILLGPSDVASTT